MQNLLNWHLIENIFRESRRDSVLLDKVVERIFTGVLTIVLLLDLHHRTWFVRCTEWYDRITRYLKRRIVYLSLNGVSYRSGISKVKGKTGLEMWVCDSDVKTVWKCVRHLDIDRLDWRHINCCFDCLLTACASLLFYSWARIELNWIQCQKIISSIKTLNNDDQLLWWTFFKKLLSK